MTKQCEQILYQWLIFEESGADDIFLYFVSEAKGACWLQSNVSVNRGGNSSVTTVDYLFSTVVVPASTTAL